MAIQTCPTTIIKASEDRVWRLLAIPGELQRWSGLKIVKGPDREMAKGDEVVFRAGLGDWFEIRFHIKDLERLRRLALEVHFPFGIVNEEVIVITPQPNGVCRVTYN